MSDYFNTHSSRDFQSGTFEADNEAYEQQVNQEKLEVEQGERDSSYLQALEELEQRRQAITEKEPAVGPVSGMDYNVFNELPNEAYNLGQQPSQDTLFPTDLEDEDQTSSLDAPVRSDGSSIYEPSDADYAEMGIPTPAQEALVPLASRPSFRDLSEHPRYNELRLDLLNEDSRIFPEEEELIGNMQGVLRSIGDIRLTPDYQRLVEQINNINENFPHIAQIYGGEDGIIQPDEVLKEFSGASYQNISTSYRNLLTKKFSKRSHALTEKNEYGLTENLQEAQNRFDKGVGRFFRDAISSVEFTYDNWRGLRRYDENSGLYLDTETNQPYRPEVLDLFPGLRDHNPWTTTQWGGLMEFLGYQLFPAWGTLGTAGAFGKAGIFNPKGLPIPGKVQTLGLRKPLGGGAVRDALLFAPGNIFMQDDPLAKGVTPFPRDLIPAINAALDENIPLSMLKERIPEFTEGAPLYTVNAWNHPTAHRLRNIFLAQGMETMETYAVMALGIPVGHSFKKMFRHGGLGKAFGPKTDFSILNNLVHPKRLQRSMYAGKTASPLEMDNIPILNRIFKRNEANKQIQADMAWSQFAGDDEWLGSDGLLNPNMGAYKLKDNLKQPGQAVVLDVGKPAEILDAANTKTLESPMGVSGSSDSLFSPLHTKQIVNNGLEEGTFSELSKLLQEDPRYQQVLKSLPKKERTLGKLHELVLQRQQEMLSRDASKLSPAEFWGPVLLDQPMGSGLFDGLDELNAWTLNNVITADNINTAIFTTLRDRAIAGREIEQVADIFSIDGPLRTIADNLTLGMVNVKRSRYMWRLIGKLAQEGKLTKEALPEIIEKVAKQTELYQQDTREGIKMMLELLEKRNTDEVANALLEMFSMSDDIHNWADFDAWMKAKLLGGDFAGKKGDGVLIEEMQGVMINSILSGPKTPLRALMGTATNSYFNAINEAAGALIRTPFTDDVVSRRAALTKVKGMFELVPEAWTVFRRKMSANWSGDIRQIKTRYHTQRGGKSDEPWELFQAWGDLHGSDGMKAAINVGNVGRNLNDNKWTTGNIRIMASIDDTFKWLLARVRSKEKALRSILAEMGDDFTDITPDMLSKAEDIQYSHLLDADGNINLSKDAWLRKQFQEVTLTEDIGKLGEALDRVFDIIPMAKPFYLFARSGINGLKVSFKNTPLVSLLMEESRAILMHTGDDFADLAKFGISNAEDLANARNLFTGRQAVGSAITMAMFTKYASGQLTGNGPADKQLKQQWINSGWRPNTITFGDVVFDYSSLEPYNLLLSAIADIGDNGQLMGSEWSEKRLQAIGFVIGRGLTGKTYLSGLDQLMQMSQGRNWNKNIANILNNSLPLAGLRNEVGKFLNPHMKELNSSMWASIRNRNQFLEPLAHINPFLDPLAEKADILNGQPIQDWNFIQRGFNAISPIQINIKSKSKGRLLLQQSNYDQESTVYGYNGYSFSRSAKARSLFQTAMGKAEINVGGRSYKNLEHYLNVLAADPTIQTSLNKMRRDALNPSTWDLDPNNSYSHNDRIDNGFQAARAVAWATIKDHPVIIELIQKQDSLKSRQREKRRETSVLGQRDALLNIPK